MTTTPVTIVGATIDQRAMLVDLDIKLWSPFKTDEKVSRDVAAQHNAKRSAGNYRKRLIEKDALLEIRAIAREAYLYHMNCTLPWFDNGGGRLLNATKFFEYEQRMRDVQHRLSAAVAKFVAIYPQLVNEMSRSLNGLFDASDYPDSTDVAYRFGVSYRVMPVPTAQDFRVDLGAKEVDRIRQQIEQTTDAAWKDAMRDVYSRIFETVGRMADRLKKYVVTDNGVQNAFRDSLVGNVRELVDLLPALNITGDPVLTDVTKRMRESLTVYDGDTLRASAAARIETAKAADDILATVSAFMAK